MGVVLSGCNRPPEISEGILHGVSGRVEVEAVVSLEERPGFVIDLEHVIGRIRELLVHFCESGELLEIISGQAHIALDLPLIDTFTENGAGVSVKVLVEFDCDQAVSGDKLAHVGDFYIQILPSQQPFPHVFYDPGNPHLSGVFGHVGV